LENGTKAGTKKSQVIEAWKNGKKSGWKLGVKTNQDLTSQVLANEKKMNALKELNKSLETNITETKHRLERLQQNEDLLLKSNKRLSSA